MEEHARGRAPLKSDRSGKTGKRPEILNFLGLVLAAVITASATVIVNEKNDRIHDNERQLAALAASVNELNAWKVLDQESIRTLTRELETRSAGQEVHRVAPVAPVATRPVSRAPIARNRGLSETLAAQPWKGILVVTRTTATYALDFQFKKKPGSPLLVDVLVENTGTDWQRDYKVVPTKDGITFKSGPLNPSDWVLDLSGDTLRGEVKQNGNTVEVVEVHRKLPN